MAYITLNELKEILPDILDQWIDEDDESWEWIFQEIEQKCHIGTKRKGKKWKKYIEDDIYQLKSMVDAQGTAIAAHRNDINKLASNLEGTVNNVTQLSLRLKDSVAEIQHLRADITVAKSMAQTAKQRTDVDYTKCSKEKSDADVVQEVYNRMSGRGATFEELDGFRNLIQKYDALEKKEIQVIKKTCETCKHKNKRSIEYPCDVCGTRAPFYYDRWEAKE